MLRALTKFDKNIFSYFSLFWYFYVSSMIYSIKIKN